MYTYFQSYLTSYKNIENFFFVQLQYTELIKKRIDGNLLFSRMGS